MTIGTRVRLFLKVAAVTGVMVALKAVTERFHLDVLPIDAVFSGIGSGTIFIMGFVLSSLLPDFKEAERVPSDIRTALDALHDDVAMFAQEHDGVDRAAFETRLRTIAIAVVNGLASRSEEGHIARALAETAGLVPFVAGLGRFGMSDNAMTRLRGNLDLLRRSLYRIRYVERVDSLPSLHVLMQVMAATVLLLMPFLALENLVGAAILFAFVTFLFVYALHLMAVFDRPFHQIAGGADTVDMFLLEEFLAGPGAKRDARR